MTAAIAKRKCVNRRRISPEDRPKFRADWNQGVGLQAIAGKYGISIYGCYQTAAEMGLPKRGKCERPAADAPVMTQDTIPRSYNRRNGSISKPKSERAGQRALRKCLGGCGGMFVSEWPGHRVCPACKSGDRFQNANHLSEAMGECVY